MSNHKDESWRTIFAAVFVRLFLLLVLYLPIYLAAWLLTMPIFFMHEHPFMTNQHSDYEKMPNAMGTYLSVPAWFLYGVLAGRLSAWGLSPTARVWFLTAWGVILTILCLFAPDTFWTHHRPAWVPAVLAISSAVRASSYFVRRTQSRSWKTFP